ncbi:MAG: glutathione S-transferase [Bradymonadia bacterium]|jgi:glutathione S-transferase
MPASNPPALTLFYAPRTRARTALWLLEELGEPYALSSFDLSSGRHKQPDYLALNPMGKVPVLVHAGQAVAELGAIAIYLADRFPAAKLAPTVTDPARADYLRWCFFASAVMEPCFGEAFFKWDVPARSVAWGCFADMLKTLEDAVTDREWLLGDTFSAADILVGATAGFGVRFGVIAKDGPICAYAERCLARPAAQRADMIEAREGAHFPQEP